MKYLLWILTALTLALMVLFAVVVFNANLAVKEVEKVDNRPSSLTVTTNTGEQKTVSHDYLQPAKADLQPATVNLQPANVCLQGCAN